MVKFERKSNLASKNCGYGEKNISRFGNFIDFQKFFGPIRKIYCDFEGFALNISGKF